MNISIISELSRNYGIEITVNFQMASEIAPLYVEVSKNNMTVSRMFTVDELECTCDFAFTSKLKHLIYTLLDALEDTE